MYWRPIYNVINKRKNNNSVAFAHSISGDFDHPRQMTAGVAVVFKNRFGKPLKETYLTKYLACQRYTEGAALYSLITKGYNGKPIEADYDRAFKDLTDDFKRGGFNTLVCSRWAV